jgi:hypothetical protein
VDGHLLMICPERDDDGLHHGVVAVADPPDELPGMSPKPVEAGRAGTLYLPKIPSAQVEQLFGFGGGRMSWLLREGPLAAA